MTKLLVKGAAVAMPSEIAVLAARWGFSPAEELAGGHCSRVFADATRVLKAPFQGEELTSGFRAAGLIAEAGGPAIYECDPSSGAVLMERLIPGVCLSEADLGEEREREIFVGLARRMQRLSVSGAMPLSEFFTLRNPLLDELDATTERRTFLHGDLHHGNILNHGPDWRPIDPKGLCGDPHFECAAYLRNPIQRLETVDDILAFTRPRLLALASELGLDPWRIAAWGLMDRLDCDDPPFSCWSRLREVYDELLRTMRRHKLPAASPRAEVRAQAYRVREVAWPGEARLFE